MVGEEGSWVVLISAIIFISFALLCLFYWLSWRWSERAQSVDPYSGVPLRRASDIPYSSAEKIMRYLYNLKQYDNRIFRLSRSAFCRQTGRIFQDCVSWLDTIHLDWTFLNKRLPGKYVSWGSLTKEQQEDIRSVHKSMEGFQTEVSSSIPVPRLIESEFAYTKPGPLYVDIDTKTLLGWKEIPGTEFEVLIVQKPIK